jgi:hypothetical protein
MRDHTIIFTISNDVHGDRIEKLAGQKGPVIRLDMDKPADWKLDYNDGDVRINHLDRCISIESINSVLLRRIPDIQSFREIVPKSLEKYRGYIADQFFTLFSDCMSILDKETLFVNPLASNNNLGKSVQHRVASSLGLSTPRTYAGSDAATAADFCHSLLSQGSEICTKPVQNVKISVDGAAKTRFTEKLPANYEENLHSLPLCPIIFQNYIEKSYEIRGTIIGEQIFACRIDSQAAQGRTSIDWRHYNIPKTPHSPISLPEDVCEKIRILHRRLGVHFGNFDLICQPDGEYVFLETNPYGQWLWIEDLTGMPISATLTEYLTSR